MSVSVLLITHAGLGSALLTAARAVIGPLPLRADTMGYANGDAVDAACARAGRLLQELDQGMGVLVLTDLYGATPSNIASRLLDQGVEMRRVSGVNLPMLLRVLNYHDQNLEDLVAIAAAGARTGVVIDSA